MSDISPYYPEIVSLFVLVLPPSARIRLAALLVIVSTPNPSGFSAKLQVVKRDIR